MYKSSLQVHSIVALNSFDLVRLRVVLHHCSTFEPYEHEQKLLAEERENTVAGRRRGKARSAWFIQFHIFIFLSYMLYEYIRVILATACRAHVVWWRAWRAWRRCSRRCRRTHVSCSHCSRASTASASSPSIGTATRSRPHPRLVGLLSGPLTRAMTRRLRWTAEMTRRLWIARMVQTPFQARAHSAQLLQCNQLHLPHNCLALFWTCSKIYIQHVLYFRCPLLRMVRGGARRAARERRDAA